MASPADQALQLVTLRQAKRRSFNERLAAMESADPDAETTLFRCECGLIACGAAIRLSPGEYEELRAEPKHFAVLSSHAIPEGEHVVARHRGWVTVEKLPGPGGDLAASTHRRSSAKRRARA